MLVEAEDAEDALDQVKGAITYAEEAYPAWSDWHEIGGRWDGLFEGWEETRNVLGYAENKQLADDMVEHFLGNRIQTMRHYLEQVSAEKLSLEEKVKTYNPYEFDYKDVHGVWSIQRLGKLLLNDWTSDTGVYDLKEHTANLEYFKKRAEENPTKQFLVPVDFHF